MDTTVVVVPCFNESQRLPTERFAEFARRNADIHFLLVNDGSADDTLNVLERLQREVPQQSSVLNLAVNMGKAEAVRQGLQSAIQSPSPRQPAFVAYWDADLATPLEAVLEFREVLRRRPLLRLVMGCRLPLLGHAVRRNWWRARLGQVFAWVATCLLRTPVHDTQCGAKMFRVTPELSALLEAPFSSRWIFDLELLMRLREHEASRGGLNELVFEYPLESWREVEGSKVRAHDFARAAGDLVTLFRQYGGLTTAGAPPIVPHPAAAQGSHPNRSATLPAEEPPLMRPRRRSA
jgi:dolichyl-phosphate beta-glucosyltransferase